MKQMNNRNKQSGFLAVGLGLALTAIFGVFAAAVETTARDQKMAKQPVKQTAELAYQGTDN
jgi:hypothetical protein